MRTFWISQFKCRHPWTLTFSVSRHSDHLCRRTCLSSRSPILRTVKLVELLSIRPSFLLFSSSDRKLECHSSSWSRQGKMVWTTPASSITSSCIPRRYTPSMIRNVRTWWNSVWINSERQTGRDGMREDKRQTEYVYFYMYNICIWYKNWNNWNYTLLTSLMSCSPVS